MRLEKILLKGRKRAFFLNVVSEANGVLFGWEVTSAGKNVRINGKALPRRHWVTLAKIAERSTVESAS